MIKKILYIFIPILSVLLMSHNSYAAVSTFDLNNYTVVSSGYRPPFTCTFDNSTTVNGWEACSIGTNGNHTLTTIITSGLTWTIKKGDIVEFDIAVFTPSNYRNEHPVLYAGNGLTYNNLLIFDVRETVNDHLYIIDNFTSSTGTMNDGTYFSHVYHFSAQVLKDFSGQLGLSSNSASFPIFAFHKSQADTFYFRMSNLVLWRKSSTNPINDEQSKATQDAADDSATSGSSSSSSSQTATSSLLSVITSGIGAITSASPTNCKVNGNMGNLNVGNIDLCANPVPTFMTLIGSIIAVLVVLPLVILLFNRFISIIRSFQR